MGFDKLDEWMDGGFSFGRPSLLLFPKTLRNDNNIINIILGTIDAGNTSVSLSEKLTAKCLVLFANGGTSTFSIYFTRALS